MKQFSQIDLGYSDATSYRNNKKYREMFEKVFVKDDNFEKIMRPDTYFLMGDKGTGKTAYAVFLENREHNNTTSKVIDVINTDYSVFIKLEKLGLIQLSDFARVWRIILMMLMANEIKKSDISMFGPKRSEKFVNLKNKIDEYYDNAFIPEISSTFRYLLDNTITQDIGINTELKSSLLGISGSIAINDKDSLIRENNIQKFQNNLLLLERDFCNAFKKLKLNKSQFIFIDSIDIKSDDFSSKEYDSCLRGLGQAIWDVNANVFRDMPDAKGFLKVVLSIRTDLFPKLCLHNQANKVRDNSILLDWRTTYDNYRNSQLFKLCNRLLAYNNDFLEENEYWDYYFPWSKYSAKSDKRNSSFINCMRYSLSRPRDMISIMKAIQNTNKKNKTGEVSSIDDFEANETENEISNYYIDEARDWCFHRFSNDEFETLLFFFQFLNGKSRISYGEYKKVFCDYIKQVKKRKMPMPSELDDNMRFLQILFDLNMICYLDKDKYGNDFFRFCYREREVYQLTPKVKENTSYVVHYSLLKSLNLGRSSRSDDDQAPIEN